MMSWPWGNSVWAPNGQCSLKSDKGHLSWFIMAKLLAENFQILQAGPYIPWLFVTRFSSHFIHYCVSVQCFLIWTFLDHCFTHHKQLFTFWHSSCSSQRYKDNGSWIGSREEAHLSWVIYEPGHQRPRPGWSTAPPPPVHQQQAPAKVANSSNPGNPVIMNEYNSFNLANVTLPIAPKWKNNEFMLDEYCKCQCSCRMIFDEPMAHITSGKVNTNMFLIWASPDRQDIYKNFNLTATQHHDIDCDAVIWRILCPDMQLSSCKI